MKTKLFFIAAVLSSAAAYAVDYEISFGQTNYKNPLDTLWRTPGFDNNLDNMKARSGEFAITHNIWESADHNYGLNLRGSYVYLGSIHTSALSPNRNTNTSQGEWVGEDFIGANPASPCNGACTNLATFNGSGHDMGFTLQLEPYVRYEGWKFGVNAGLYEHKITWAMNVKNIWDGIENHDIVVESDGKWSMGKVIGVSVEKENITVRAQVFMTPLTGGKYPQAWDKAYMLSIGWKF